MQQRRHRLNTSNSFLEDEQGSSSVSSTVKERVFAAAYLAICAVAMTGWLIALGWAAIRLANWLFF